MDDGMFGSGMVARHECPTQTRSATQLVGVLVVCAERVEGR